MGTISEKITYLNTTKSNIKDSIELMGTTITSQDTFRSYADKIKTQLKLFLADNSVDRIWNNWEKVSATNVETTSLSPTIKGKMEISLKGNTSQTGTPTPDSPIPVNIVSGNNSINISNGDNTESQTYPINLPFELCKIGNYQDRIFKAIDGDSFYDTLDSATKQTLTSGGWYKYGAIGKYILDGTNNAFGTKSGQQGNCYTFNTSNFIAGPALNIVPSVLSNKFISKSWDDRNNYLDNTIMFIYLTATSLVFRFGTSSSLTTLALANTWLENNNVTLYGILATPTYTKITNTTLISQLEAIKYSYDSQTNISQTNADLPFMLDVSALEEM